MLAPIHIVDDDGNDAPDRRDRHRVVRAAAEPARLRVPQGRSEDARLVRRRTAGRRVGDMGYLDDDGYLYLTDRRTFMIVSGGVNIYPQEAENVLINHPKVFDVAVFGIPDAEMGEKVHARRATDGVGRRGTRARTRAARVLPRPTSRTTSARRRSTSIPSCRANRPASSTSASCATATGATRRHASCDGNPAVASRADATETSSSSAPAACCDAPRESFAGGRGTRDGVRTRQHGYPVPEIHELRSAAPRSSWSASTAR